MLQQDCSPAPDSLALPRWALILSFPGSPGWGCPGAPALVPLLAGVEDCPQLPDPAPQLLHCPGKNVS